MNKVIDISVIISLSSKQKHDNILELFKAYKSALDSTELNYEYIYVTDSESTEILNDLNSLQEQEDIEIVKLGRWFGEASALNAGVEQAKSSVILTLPPFRQIDEKEIPSFIESFRDADMLIASRSRAKDNFMHKTQAKIFHSLVKMAMGVNYKDLGCRIRIFKKEVLEKTNIYGDQYRFFPLLANRHGFKVKEFNVTSYFTNSSQRIYSLGHYTERIVDFISVFFLTKFTKKPLRFFGFPGFIIFSIGALVALILFIQRAFFSIGLADRPIVLVSILLIVFGIQLFAIGLVAEIIIFTHSKDSKEYIVEEVYQKKTGESVETNIIKIKEHA